MIEEVVVQSKIMELWDKLGLEDTGAYEKGLFFITAGLMVGLAFVGISNPDLLSSKLNSAFDWVLHYFGWWFLLLGTVLLVFALFMAFSRYGNIRIGGPDAEPEFDTFSWVSMVFTAGFGPAILVWGVGEPISIMVDPPPNSFLTGGESLKSLALAFMFLHDAFPGAAMWYFPLTLGFALMAYSHGTGEYKISSMLTVAFDKETYWWLYWIVDLTALIAIIGGMATALGFTAQQLTTLLNNVFGLQAARLTYGLFGVIALILLGDIWLGLRRGIRNAARITMILVGVSMVLLLLVGPTLFIFNIWLDATGIWLNNLPRFLLYTAPTAQGDWPQQWTAFWWAYWASWSLFVGSFVARISKGRTIRETFSVVVIVPAVLAWIQHAILGGWVLSSRYIGPVSDALNTHGFPAALAKAVTLTPMGNLLGILFVVVSVGYLITTLDSAVYMLAALSLGEENPNGRNRAWWGIIAAFFGIMTVNIPAFSAIQAFAPTLSLIFTLFFVLLMYVSYSTVRNHRQNGSAPINGDSFGTSRESESTPDPDRTSENND